MRIAFGSMVAAGFVWLALATVADDELPGGGQPSGGQPSRRAASDAPSPPAGPTAAEPSRESSELERGEYLTVHVAMCVQCHSPRDARGRLIESRLLHGATIPVAPPEQQPAWAFRAPRLAGLPGRDQQDLVHLLVTGRDRSGWQPRPPMPPFRLTEEDARAVARYLQSLR